MELIQRYSLLSSRYEVDLNKLTDFTKADTVGWYFTDTSNGFLLDENYQ
jgi:hypothetical protein